jgi:hypothetical protein
MSQFTSHLVLQPNFISFFNIFRLGQAVGLFFNTNANDSEDLKRYLPVFFLQERIYTSIQGYLGSLVRTN